MSEPKFDAPNSSSLVGHINYNATNTYEPHQGHKMLSVANSGINGCSRDEEPSPHRKRRGADTFDGSPSRDDSTKSTKHQLHKRGRVTFAKPMDATSSNGAAGDDDDGTQSLPSDEPWSQSLHRMFVEAVYEAGLKHASPAVIMEMMENPPDSVTSERVKSHLQKYRNNKDKNKDEFMKEYDEWMNYVNASNGRFDATIPSLPPPLYTTPRTSSLTLTGPPDRLHGADLAACLTYAVLNERTAAVMAEAAVTSASDASHNNIVLSTLVSAGGSCSTPQHDQEVLQFPMLTKDELETPLGEALANVMGLFQPLVQCVLTERAANGSESGHYLWSRSPGEASSSSSGP